MSLRVALMAATLAVAGVAGVTLTANSATADESMNKLGQNFYGCADGQNTDPAKLSDKPVSCGDKMPVQTVYLNPQMD